MAVDRFPRPVLRTRLYEQVAEQITGWIAQNGSKAGDRHGDGTVLTDRRCTTT